MDDDIRYELRLCYISNLGDPKNACQIIENNLEVIDFDDRNDVEELIDIIKIALTYIDGNETPRYEDGLDFLKFLMDKGFDVTFKINKNDCLILKLAESEIMPEIFQKVVDLGADAYAERHDGKNALTCAAAAVSEEPDCIDCENSERLPIYIAENFDLSRLDCPDGCGLTPLMYAVINNKARLIDTLLKNGSNVDATGGEGSYNRIKMNGVSPLALAFRYGNAEIAKMLLDSGADETLCDAEGTPALFSLLFAGGKKEIGAEFQAEVDKRKGEIVKLLKNPDFADSDGNTLLMKALTVYRYNSDKDISRANNEYIINELLQRGVNIHSVNNKGQCAIHFAATDYSALKNLIAAGADIDAQDNSGNTALMLACMSTAEKSARLLVRKGADFNIKNNNGKSAMDIAVEEGLTDVLELMI